MKKWIISTIAALMIIGAGIFAFFYIHKHVPQQLTVTSGLVINEEEGIEKEADLKEIIHHTQKRVVQIELDNGSFGSGFLYNELGDVVTNAHVVANAKVNVRTSIPWNTPAPSSASVMKRMWL